MPSKSRRKKFKYSSKKQNSPAQKPTAVSAPQISETVTPAVSKPPSATAKLSPSAAKIAAAQYAPDQFKYVGTELKVAGTISAIILVIIIALYFILH